MAEKTGIAWCDHTFNPWIGCTKVSPGCDSCYAEALDKRHRWGGGVHWGSRVPRLRTSPSNWELPLKWDRKAAAAGERRLVFCASLADVFDNEVPREWCMDLFSLIEATPRLTWLLLTKRIGNVARMLPFYWLQDGDGFRKNVWIGASVVNQEEADRDIQKLLATPAAKRFVSYEPALSAVDFSPWLGDRSLKDLIQTFPPGAFPLPAHLTQRPAIDWLIVGGESKQGRGSARPFQLEWARSAIAQCREAGVAVFVKQLGSEPRYPIPGRVGHALWLKDRAGADPAEWPTDLQVQEFPA